MEGSDQLHNADAFPPAAKTRASGIQNDTIRFLWYGQPGYPKVLFKTYILTRVAMRH
jgi:hypothetical protein